GATSRLGAMPRYLNNAETPRRTWPHARAAAASGTMSPDQPLTGSASASARERASRKVVWRTPNIARDPPSRTTTSVVMPWIKAPATDGWTGAKREIQLPQRRGEDTGSRRIGRLTPRTRRYV